MTMILAIAFSAQRMFATDCSVPINSFGISLVNAFDITASGFTSSDIQAAASYWACPGRTGFIPTFQVGGSGNIPVSVVRIVGRSTAPRGGCGLFDPTVVNGQLQSASITVWTQQANGASCSPLTDSIAHEFGHLLGLDDAPDPLGQCLDHIMGGRAEGFTRTVQDDDCAVADDKWETTNESGTPPDPFCDAYCDDYCVNNVCQNHPSPILLDMENDGVHLTGLDDPVWFDINADGRQDLISWTDRSEGFLALDRNGNGKIDDGSELFGNATRLSDGTRAPNGYVALAELDSPVFGGNGDGHIDSADAVYSSLRLWIDRNHDGISQSDELVTLTEASIERIGLGYRQSPRRDRYGNQFRFVGRAWKMGHNGVLHPILTWDVFFLLAH
ncbi:MAG TPA: hypothetical protein VLV54_12195 [Thermoanaerobaculia bacterium]|nr:hypothetical protein [Thermoanaerobaculia bacterium]